MARYDLSDAEWGIIEPLLPNKSRGVPRVDDRRILNGISWGLSIRCALAGFAEHLRSSLYPRLRSSEPELRFSGRR